MGVFMSICYSYPFKFLRPRKTSNFKKMFNKFSYIHAHFLDFR